MDDMEFDQLLDELSSENKTFDNDEDNTDVPEAEGDEAEAEESAEDTDIPEAVSESEQEDDSSISPREDYEDGGLPEEEPEDIEILPKEESAETDAEADEEYDEDEEYSEEDEEEELAREREEERLRLKEKRSRKKRKKKAHGRLAFALILVTLVLTVAVGGSLAFITVASEVLGLGRSDSQFSVEIPENSGTEAIADILLSEGIIGNTTLFRVVSKLKGADGTYIAGSHKLNPNMTYSDIIEALQEEAINPRDFINITFPEGIRLIEAAEKLEEGGVCSAEEFIRVFNSTTFGFDFEENVVVSPKKFYKMEGYFFPDTYQFYLDEDPVNVAKKVCKNFEYRITPDYYGRMNDIGMTPEDVFTLASIVQREAGDNRNMKLVASVFLNRLNNPDEYPQLQSDPTSSYVREVIIPNLEISSESICNAYDTYKGAGLPPGPICNPGLAAIEAVLYPRETDYYYFCSSLDTEEFYYARTYEEHLENLAEAGLSEAGAGNG